MRVLVVTTSYPRDRGGDFDADDPAGHFVRCEAVELERTGHDVVVVTPRPGGAFGWPGVAARVRENPLRAFDAAAWIARAGVRVARLRDIDRVIAHWAVPCAFPIAFASQSRAPLEVVSHGGDVRLLRSMPTALRLAIVHAIVARAHRWRFVSHDLRDDLFASLRDDARKKLESIAFVEAARIEIPDVRELAMRVRTSLGRGLPVAVTVARLVASKRIDAVIAHAASRETRLIVVGDGPERARLEALARSRGVDARFVGKVPRTEALAWIAAADVLVHASRDEGLSTVVREAEALGTRVERLA